MPATVTKRSMIVLYAVLACLLAIIVGPAAGLPIYWRLLNAGRATPGTVVRTACDAHGSVFYRFTVAGRQYAGHGNAGYGTPECRQLRENDQIVVYYLPADPTVSQPGEIDERWKNQLVFFVLAVIVFPAFIVSVVWWRLPRHYRAGPK